MSDDEHEREAPEQRRVPSDLSPRPVVGDRPSVTRDRRERSDPHDPSVPEVLRRLRPAEVHNAPPGRRAPARDAASRHGSDAPTVFDFATGKERSPQQHSGAPVLPPSRSSPPPSAPPEPEEAVAPRTVGLKGRGVRPGPGGGAANGPATRETGPDLLPREAAPWGRAPAEPAPGAAPAEVRRAPGAPRRLGVPVPVRVQAGADGRPARIEGDTVDAVRESWLIEDRWWTDRPLRRRYWEVVTTAGRDSIVFRDLVDGRWYRQR